MPYPKGVLRHTRVSPEPRVQVNTTLPPALYDEVKARAKEAGITCASMFERLLKEALA